MNFRKIYERNRQILKVIILVCVTFVSSVVVPLVVYSEFVALSKTSGVDIRDYLEQVQMILICCVILGVILTNIVLLTFFQQRISKKHLILSIASLSITSLYIFAWSRITAIRIKIDLVTIWFDLSSLYTFFVLIPIVLIGKKLILYKIAKKDLKFRIYLLGIIQCNNRKSSKTQLRKVISKDPSIDNQTRDFLLKNLSKLIVELENGLKPLISKKKGYNLTKDGKLFYNSYGISLAKVNKEIHPPKVIDINDLEYWTEEELEKLNKNVV